MYGSSTSNQSVPESWPLMESDPFRDDEIMTHGGETLQKSTIERQARSILMAIYQMISIIYIYIYTIHTYIICVCILHTCVCIYIYINMYIYMMVPVPSVMSWRLNPISDKTTVVPTINHKNKATERYPTGAPCSISITYIYIHIYIHIHLYLSHI